MFAEESGFGVTSHQTSTATTGRFSWINVSIHKSCTGNEKRDIRKVAVKNEVLVVVTGRCSARSTTGQARKFFVAVV
jgi:hypothetical protein